MEPSPKEDDSPTEEEIFLMAINLPEDERLPLIDEACGDDVAMRERLEDLLAAHGGEVFMAEPVSEIKEVGAKPGDVIGPYTLLEQLGAGGFGTVWLAEQSVPFQRKVALKLIKPGMDTNEVIARFSQERQALALMDHPNIAKVFDAGATEAGHPYFAMEWVQGVSITKYANEKKLTLEERLELFASVCRAIQHAHQKGIIHRDLKPSNLLVSERDGHHEATVIDFGIAKAIMDDRSGALSMTHDQQILGTPAYMSPEQAGYGFTDIDTRTDIYSLGAVLYELLTGVPPVDPGTTARRSPEQLRLQLTEKTPISPSVKWRTTDTIPDHLERSGNGQGIQRELDWITLKALQREPSRRYEAASDLAQDIERFLNNLPVSAGPPSRLYALQKFVARNRALVAGGTLLALSLMGGIGVSTWMAVRANRAETETRSAFVQLNLLQGNQSTDRGDSAAALLWYERAWDLDVHHSRPEAHHRQRIAIALAQIPVLAGLCLQPEEIIDAAFNPQADRVLTRTDGDSVAVWDPFQGRQLFAPLRHEARVLHAEFDASGHRIVTSSADNTARVWDAATGEQIAKWEHPQVVHWADFEPTDDLLATACDDARVRVWNIARPSQPPVILEGNSRFRFVKFVEESRVLITVNEKEVAEIWSWPGLKRLGGVPHQLNPGNPLDRLVQPPLWDSRRKRLFTIAETIRFVWNAESRQAERFDEKYKLNGMAVDPAVDSVLLASQTVDAFLAQAGRKDRPLKLRHPREVQFGSISGNQIATASSGGLVHLWNGKTGRRLVAPIRHISTIQRLAFSEDGRFLLVASRDGTARVWDVSVSEYAARDYDFSCGRSHLYDDRAGIAYSPDGKLELRYGRRHEFTVHLANSEALTATVKTPEVTQSAHFNANGDRVVLIGEDSLSLVSPDDWSVQSRIETPPAERSIFDEPFHHVAQVYEDGTVSVWDLSKSERVFHIAEWPHGRPEVATLSRDGKRLAVGGKGVAAPLEVIDLESSHSVIIPIATGLISSLEFDPDGRRLLMASTNNTATVWDAVTGEALSSILRHPTFVRRAVFSPEGDRVLTGASGGYVRLWNWRTGEILMPAIDIPSGSVRGLWFSSDATQFAVKSNKGRTFIYRLPETKLERKHVSPLLKLMTGNHIDQAGGIAILPSRTFRDNPDEFLEAWKAWKHLSSPHPATPVITK